MQTQPSDRGILRAFIQVVHPQALQTGQVADVLGHPRVVRQVCKTELRGSQGVIPQAGVGRLCFVQLPLLFEKILQQAARLPCPDTTLMHRLVIQSRLIKEVDDRTSRTRFRLQSAPHHPLHASLQQGTRAHGAGFQRHVKRAIVQTVIAQLGCGLTQGQDLGMGTGVVHANRGVVRLSQYLTMAHDHRAHGHFTCRLCQASLVQCQLHEVIVCGVHALGTNPNSALGVTGNQLRQWVLTHELDSMFRVVEMGGQIHQQQMLPKRVDSVPLVVQQTPSVRRGVLQGCDDVCLGQTKTSSLHGFVKCRTLPPVGVDDQHLRMICRMPLNKACELLGMVAFIQHIAANDEIELTQRRFVPRPVPCGICHVGQPIESQISPQETLGIGMHIGCGDVAQSPVNDQTGQAQTTANFQDTKLRKRPCLHQVGHLLCRRPYQAKQGPSSRSHAKR